MDQIDPSMDRQTDRHTDRQTGRRRTLKGQRNRETDLMKWTGPRLKLYHSLS